MAAAKRDLVAPGFGALHMIPMAAVTPNVSPPEMVPEPVCNSLNQLQQDFDTAHLSLLEIALDDAHLIGDMGKADYGLVFRRRKSVTKSSRTLNGGFSFRVFPLPFIASGWRWS